MSSVRLCDILNQRPQQALYAFMRRWHGIVPEMHAVPAADRLPAVLRRFYEAFGTAPEAFLVNRLLVPADIADDDGFCVFYVEEQAVYLWAIATADLGADDPPVWCRENEPGKPWVQESPSVSVFLLQMVVMSAALNGPHGACAAWLAPDKTRAVLASLLQLDLPPWHWPGHPARWYAGEHSVAFTCPNIAAGDDALHHLSVWVGSLTEDGVGFVEPHLSEAWEYYSPRDG